MFRKIVFIAAALVSASAAIASPPVDYTPLFQRPTWNERLFHRVQMTGCQTCQYEFHRCEWRCAVGNYGGYMTYNQCLGVCGVAGQACMANYC